MDAVGCLVRLHAFVCLVDELLKVKVRISHLKAADVELVLEEVSDVFNGVLLAEVAPDLIADSKDGIDDFLLLVLIVIHVAYSFLFGHFGAFVLRGIWFLIHCNI